MSIIVWNVRGLNSPTRKRDVKQHLVKYKIDLMGIVERKLSNDKIDGFCKSINGDWKAINNYDLDSREE